MKPLVLDGERVATYNPLRRVVVDRTRLQQLGSLLDNCAFRMSSALSGALRRPTRFAAGQFEQGTWDEYRLGMEESTFIMTMPITGLEERVALHIPIKTALHFFEIQMGAETPGDSKRDALTDLEFTMIGNLATSLCMALKAALTSIIELGTSVQSHRSPHALRMGRAGDACFRVQMTATIGDSKPKPIWLYFQVATIRSMLETVEEQEENEPQEGQVLTLEDVMTNVPLPVAIAYPPVLMQASDVLTWRKGTTFSLGLSPGERAEVEILVDRVRVGKGRKVQTDLKYVCVIEEWERSF